MKKLFVLVLLLCVSPLLLLHAVGIPPRGLPDAVAVGTGLTAKLACSGYFLSGMSEAQNRADVASYSPAARAVSLTRQGDDTFLADIAGYGTAVARYRPGLGCTLQYPDAPSFGSLEAPAIAARSGDWPQGEDVRAYHEPVQRLLEELLEEDRRAGLDTRALLVVQDGTVAAEAYAEGFGVATPLLGWSMAKSVTAILLGRQEALGLVQVGETGLFPEWTTDERSAISLRDLLQMVSGLAFEEPYVPGSDSTRMLFLSPSAAAVALQSSLAHSPGEHFYYSSGTTNLLAYLAWLRIGSDSQAMLDFFARELAAPLGLRHTTFEVDASGVYVGSSFLYAPARDWARLGLLMLNDGVANDRRLLPAGWVARATAPNGSANDPRYGYQFWLNGGGKELRWPDLDPDAYAMMGNRGQVVMMLPTRGALIVRLGWTAGEYPTSERLGRLQALL
jgi:CubicO group peptidase (beta-lactamase class C family)